MVYDEGMMAAWMGWWARGRRFLRGLGAWARLSLEVGPLPDDALIEYAHELFGEQEAWSGMMRTLQFSESASHQVLEGLVRRHGDILLPRGSELPDDLLLNSLAPLIWYFHHQTDRFPEGAVGHACALGLLHTLLGAATSGALREDVILAVQDEMREQLEDACEAVRETMGGDGWVC